MERLTDQESLLQSNRVAALAELMAAVVHEVSNQLAGALGYSQVLLARDLEAETRRDVEAIQGEVQRAAVSVQRLPAFVPRRQTEKRLVSVNEAVETTRALREPALRANNVAWAMDPQPDLPQTMADFHQLQLLFLNLLMNAEEAMAPGGGTLAVRTRQAGERIQVLFADNGPGIAPGDVPRVLEPFFTTKGEGRGLGLLLCRGILRSHEGTLHVESETGQGATFTVELPIVAGAAIRVEAIPSEPPTPKEGASQ
jgi:C4-dicarboxylate-specific signal transduction histidine kinase